MPPLPYPPEIILLALLLVLLVAVLWLVFRPAMARRDRELLLRLDTRLDEHGRRLETLSDRLGETQDRLTAANADLRGQLIERFEQLRHTVAESLADGRAQTVRALAELREELRGHLGEHRTQFEQRQLETSKMLRIVTKPNS